MDVYWLHEPILLWQLQLPCGNDTSTTVCSLQMGFSPSISICFNNSQGQSIVSFLGRIMALLKEEGDTGINTVLERTRDT